MMELDSEDVFEDVFEVKDSNDNVFPYDGMCGDSKKNTLQQAYVVKTVENPYVGKLDKKDVASTAAKNMKRKRRNGEWSIDDELKLLKLMSVYGQGWSSIAKILTSRNFHSIKMKGRNLLGETIPKISRKSKQSGAKQKPEAPDYWSKNEHVELLTLHKKFGNDFAKITECLTNRRASAKMERELLLICKCASCAKLAAKLKATGLSMQTAWTKAKALSLYQELLERKKDEDEPKSTELVIRKNGIKKTAKNKNLPVVQVKFEDRVEALQNTVKTMAEVNENLFGDISTLIAESKIENREQLSFAENLVADRAQYDMNEFLKVARCNGLVELETPSARYTINMQLDTKDPRYDVDFLFPSTKYFEVFKPVGRVVFEIQTCKAVDTDRALANDVGFPSSLGKHWWNLQPSQAAALHLFGKLMPKLMTEGEAWVHHRIVKADGTVGIFLAHVQPFRAGNSCIFSFQEVSERYPEILELPPELV